MSSAPAKLVLSVLSSLLLALGAFAQSPAYPDRPISMVVTFAAGGSSDVLARAVADAMSHGLGQQIATRGNDDAIGGLRIAGDRAGELPGETRNGDIDG